MTSDQIESDSSASARAYLAGTPFDRIPIEAREFVYQLNLPRCAERVCFFYLGRAYLTDSFDIKINLGKIAAGVCASVRSVKRAHARLQALGLIERVSSRCDRNPFRRGPSITRLHVPSLFPASTPAPIPPPCGATQDARRPLPAPMDNPSGDSSAAEAGLPDAIPEVQAAPAVESTALSKPSAIETDTREKVDAPAGEAEPQQAPQNPQIRIAEIEAEIRACDQKVQALVLVTGPDKAHAHTEAYRLLRHTQQLQAALAIARTKQGKRDESAPPPRSRDEPPPAPEAPTPRRVVDATVRCYIRRRIGALPKVSAPATLLDEIVFSLERGVQRTRSVFHAANAALKLVQTGRWRTPFGFDRKWPLPMGSAVAP